MLVHLNYKNLNKQFGVHKIANVYVIKIKRGGSNRLIKKESAINILYQIVMLSLKNIALNSAIMQLILVLVCVSDDDLREGSCP